MHDSTRGLSTPRGARENIGLIQGSLIFRFPLWSGYAQVSGKQITWRSPVKLFSLLKIPAIVLGFGAGGLRAHMQGAIGSYP